MSKENKLFSDEIVNDLQLKKGFAAAGRSFRGLRMFVEGI